MANKATVEVELNTGSLKKGISSAVDETKKLDNLKPTVEVKVDDSEVAQAKGDIEELGGTQTVNIDASQAKGVIETLKTQLSGAFESLKGGDAEGAITGFANSLASAFPLVGAVSQGMDVLKNTVGAVVGAFGDALEAGANFDKTLKQISLQTGVTGADLKKIEEGAKNAFLRGVGESADEAAKTLGSLRQVLGDAVPLENLDEAAIRANQVAQSLGTETPELVGKLSPLIKQYGISFDEALNLVASGAQKGVSDIGGYLDTIQEFTPNLKEAGFSAEEFSGLLARAGEVGLKDFAKVGDGVKEVQNRLKSGDLLTQLEGIGGATSKKLQEIAKLGQQGAISGKEVLSQSIQEIDKAFADGKISETLRGQLSTTLGGSIAEDIGTEAYSKIFSAPVDVNAVKNAATEAGKIIDENIPAPDFGKIFELAKLEIGQALNTVYKAIIVPIINPILEGFGRIKQVFVEAFGGGGAGSQVITVLKTIGSVVGSIVSGAFSVLVGIIKVVVSVFTAAFNIIGFVVNVFKALYNAISNAITNSSILTNVFNFLGNAGRVIFTVITNLGNAIVGLVQALASFDLGKIEAALGAFGNLTKEQNNAAAATTNLVGETKKLAEIPTTIIPPPKETNTAVAATNNYADALKSAREELNNLTQEQLKNRELAATESIQSETERAKKRLEIEQRYAIASLENEKKSLSENADVRAAQEAVINKKIEVLREENARKLLEIDKQYADEITKRKQDEIAKAEEQENKLTEITSKFAERRLQRLRDQLSAGNAKIANELIAAQRNVIDNGLQSTIKSIVEQTPQYVKGIEELNKKLAAGLSPDEYRDQATKLRQSILLTLQQAPADTKDIYALQIKDAYEGAADEIAKGTSEIVAQIRQQQIKQAGEIFAESLRGIGQALRDVDFATIYGDAAKQAAELNKQQEDLIDNLKTGQTTYQDAVEELQNLGESQEQTSAFAQAVAQSFQAIADQQAAFAADSIKQRDANLERIRQIADEEIRVAKDKAAAIDAIDKDSKLSQEEREAALARVKTDYANKEEALNRERNTLNEKSAEIQSAALNNIAVSAGAAFAALVTGGENAGEALKQVVGATVSSLIDLYTPSILALFSSIIPPPFGTLAGLAAVQALKILLQQALSGFEEGGYTGNGGTKQVAGVVHGQEFVMNAQVTKRNRALLEHLHAGKPLEAFPALQKMLSENQISTIPITELQLMRSELSAIRQRLDSMPNGIQGEMGVNVELGMDTYLYERDRHRMNVRRLRG